MYFCNISAIDVSLRSDMTLFSDMSLCGEVSLDSDVSLSSDLSLCSDVSMCHQESQLESLPVGKTRTCSMLRGGDGCALNE